MSLRLNWVELAVEVEISWVVNQTNDKLDCKVPRPDN